VDKITKNKTMLSEATTTCHEILASKNDDVMADLSIDKLIIVYAFNRPQQDFYLIPVAYVVNLEEIGGKCNIGQWHLSLLTEAAFLTWDEFCKLTIEAQADTQKMEELQTLNRTLQAWSSSPDQAMQMPERLGRIAKTLNRIFFNLKFPKGGIANYLDPVAGTICTNMLRLTNRWLSKQMTQAFSFTKRHFVTPIIFDESMAKLFPNAAPAKGRYSIALAHPMEKGNPGRKPNQTRKTDKTDHIYYSVQGKMISAYTKLHMQMYIILLDTTSDLVRLIRTGGIGHFPDDISDTYLLDDEKQKLSSDEWTLDLVKAVMAANPLGHRPITLDTTWDSAKIYTTSTGGVEHRALGYSTRRVEGQAILYTDPETRSALEHAIWHDSLTPSMNGSASIQNLPIQCSVEGCQAQLHLKSLKVLKERRIAGFIDLKAGTRANLKTISRSPLGLLDDENYCTHSVCLPHLSEWHERETKKVVGTPSEWKIRCEAPGCGCFCGTLGEMESLMEHHNYAFTIKPVLMRTPIKAGRSSGLELRTPIAIDPFLVLEWAAMAAGLTGPEDWIRQIECAPDLHDKIEKHWQVPEYTDTTESVTSISFHSPEQAQCLLEMIQNKETIQDPIYGLGSHLIYEVEATPEMINQISISYSAALLRSTSSTSKRRLVKLMQGEEEDLLGWPPPK
jgi:hypothetical protein